MLRLGWLKWIAFCLVGIQMAVANAETLTLYIGTGGDGMFASQFDTQSGRLSAPVRVATTPRPTFIWIHEPTSKLYSVCELGQKPGDNGAAIVSWLIQEDGSLVKQSQQDAGGDGPCFVAVSENGKYAAVANYGGGSVSLFPIRQDGSLGPATSTIQHTGSSINQRRQKEPHAHSSRFDPSGNRVAAADLGTDKVYLYDIAHDGKLSASKPSAIVTPPGSGPRHFVFSPDNRYMLILGELLGNITTVRYDPPNITPVQTVSTMAENTPEEAPRGSAEILFHPNGKWVYATNRGPNEIAFFDFEPKTATLNRKGAVSSGGKHPRNFRISPDGRFLLCANQQTNNIVVFAIDQTSGALSKTSVELKVNQPMCLKFLTKR